MFNMGSIFTIIHTNIYSQINTNVLRYTQIYTNIQKYTQMYSDIYNRSFKRNGPEGGCMFNMGRFLQNIVNSHVIGSISAFIPHKYEINNRSPAPAPLPPKKYFKLWHKISEIVSAPINVLFQKDIA